ncbi:metal ABC transporter permease [Erysipelothrix rhusiopathiae]|uniref:metal ABC transporter permease n=1 Tax=Erysipelothrix rhusiopathiae TaxID=1648 RepID=UPI00200A32F7|nr:metal ABC transporter permease [Erysipelothrix rhusiopathiae]UPU38386.1 metal ABC transporter permease [Erysipelothrix sp. Poltava]WRB93181.1 metal ABC transporter permease [Erysipelothrix rhusiopathiae]
MINAIIDLFSNYTFQIVALGSIALGILTGVTGTFAVLRKQSLLGDSIAHSALAGITVAFIMTGTKNTEILLLGALIAGLLATFIINSISNNTRINFESAMALVMSVFFGVGFILLTHIQKMPDSQQAGLERFLFGQAATILQRDVYFVIGVTLVVVVLMILLWKEIKVFSFDPIYAHSIGLSTQFLNIVLSGFIVAAIIMGIQMVGVVLMSALIIAPAVAARQWTHSLTGMTILAAVFGAISGLGGTIVSSLINKFPTGPAIVVIASSIVIISLLFAPGRGIINKGMRQHGAKQAFEGDMAIINLLTHQLLDIDAHFTKEQLQEACIIDHHREGKSFDRLFNNLKKRHMVERVDDSMYFKLTRVAKLEYEQNRGDQL